MAVDKGARQDVRQRRAIARLNSSEASSAIEQMLVGFGAGKGTYGSSTSSASENRAFALALASIRLAAGGGLVMTGAGVALSDYPQRSWMGI